MYEGRWPGPSNFVTVGFMVFPRPPPITIPKFGRFDYLSYVGKIDNSYVKIDKCVTITMAAAYCIVSAQGRGVLQPRLWGGAICTHGR